MIFNGSVIRERAMMLFLYMYIIGFFIWDFTIVYQVALLLMVAFAFIFYQTKFIPNSTYIICNAILILYFLIHTAMGLSSNNELSYDYLVTMFINWLGSCAIISILNSRDRIKKCMKACIYAALAACVYVTIADFRNLFSGELGINTTKPFFDEVYSHNEVAALAGLAILFLSYFKSENITIKCNTLLRIFFTIFVVLTGARKSFIFVVFGLLIYPFIFSKRNSGAGKKLARLMLVLSLLLILLFLVMENDFLYSIIGYRFEGYLSGIFGDGFKESSAISRSVMRKTALSLISSDPILGHGLNTFRTHQGSFGTWSHDNYLELWVSGGIIAVIIYYFPFIKTIITLIKNKTDRMSSLFLCLMFFIIVYDYMSVSFISRFMILMLSMVAAYILILKKERKAAIKIRETEEFIYE